MRNDKELAINLRKQGKSYNQIYNALKIPKSTLAGWFSEVDWSREVKTKLIDSWKNESSVRMQELNKVRGKHLKLAYSEARKEATEELVELKYSPLFISGLMLYWGEGDRISPHVVKLINTDPALIRLFVLFLIQACRIPLERIRAQILVHSDMDEQRCRTYWANKSGVLPENFIRSTVVKAQNKPKRLDYGTCSVYVSSSYFKVKMLEWLNLFPMQLMGKQFYVNM